MKRFVYIIGGILVILFCIQMSFTKGANVQDGISSKVIRFHVIANSDTDSDQALKLKVRDKVLEYIQPKLKNSKNINESRKILKDNNEKILDIARSVITENGYSYDVRTTLSKEKFPIKTYGNITLPQGEYEAFRILIGSGQGHNWWCVMFPPLCFVDITKGQVSYKETEDQMKKVLTPDEYKLVHDSMKKGNLSKDIKVQSKFLEMIKSFKK